MRHKKVGSRFIIHLRYRGNFIVDVMGMATALLVLDFVASAASVHMEALWISNALRRHTNFARWKLEH